MSQLSIAQRSGAPSWLENGGANSGAANINDVANTYPTKLLPFFGPRPPPSPDDPLLANRPFEAYFLPDAYKGRNDYLSSTLVEILLSGNSFITSRCLPMMHRDDPNIRWSTMKFDSTLVDYEAEQGVPRLITSRSATYQDFMSRRGIAFLINHGFANTEAGQLDFFYKFSAMATAMQETLDQEGILAIINCKNEYPSITSSLPDALRIGGMEPVQCFRTAVDQWGMIQKGERAFVHLDEIVKAAMSREGVTNPDTWLVPPGMRSYVTLEPAESEYYRAGPAARTNLRKGEHALDSWRGTQVFEVKDYHLDTGDIYINNFVRDRMIGDYFVIRDFAYGRYAGAANLDAIRHMRYQTDAYCCDTDTWENFTLGDALKHCGVWDEHGNLTNEFSGYVDTLAPPHGSASEKFERANNHTGRKSGAQLATWINMVNELWSQGGMTHGVLQAQCDKLDYLKNSSVATTAVANVPAVDTLVTALDTIFDSGRLRLQTTAKAAVVQEGKKHVSYLRDILSSSPAVEVATTQRTHSGHKVAVRKSSVLAKSTSNENSAQHLIEKLKSFAPPDDTDLLINGQATWNGVAHGLLYTLLNVPVGYDGTVTDQEDVGDAVSNNITNVLDARRQKNPITNQNEVDAYNKLQKVRTASNVTKSAAEIQAKRKEVAAAIRNGTLPNFNDLDYTTADMLQLFNKDLCFALNLLLTNAEGQFMANSDRAGARETLNRFAQAAIVAAAEIERIDLNENGKAASLPAGLRARATKLENKTLRAQEAMCNLTNICLIFYTLCSYDLSAGRDGLTRTSSGVDRNIPALTDPTGILAVDFGLDPKAANKHTVALREWRRKIVDRSTAGYQWYTGGGINDNTNGLGNIVSAQINDHGLAQNGLETVVTAIESLFAAVGHSGSRIKALTQEQEDRLLGRNPEAFDNPYQQPFFAAFYYSEYNKVVADRVIGALDNLRDGVVTSYNANAFPQGTAVVAIIEKLKEVIQAFKLRSDDGGELINQIIFLRQQLKKAINSGDSSTLINNEIFDTFYSYLTDPRGWTNDPAMDECPPPLSVVCTRPFKTYQMGSAVLMQSGKETGFTAHGHEDVQVGDDCIAHTHVCHFTGWYASVITNPKRIAIAGDVYCMAYERGESRNFFDHTKWNSDVAPHDPLTHLREDQENKSIIAFLAPYGAGCKRYESQLPQECRLPTPLDISGKYSQCKVNSRFRDSSMPCVDLNTALWKCNIIAEGQSSVEEQAESAVTWDAVPICNLTCFGTTQRVLGGSVNSSAVDNTAIILGQDHFGPDFTGPGAAKGRNGGTGGLLGFKKFNHESNYTVIQ